MRSKLVAIILTVAVVPFAAFAIIACSESTDGVTPPPASGPGADGATGPVVPGKDGETVVPDTGLPTGTSTVLINEISASDEWVELVASGDTAVDVSGFRLADSEKDAGGPKLSEAVTIPPGTIMSPKSYLIVKGGGLEDGGKACPDGGQSYCFHAEFGISNKSGETLFLIDAKGAVVGTTVYPPTGAAGDATWGRTPNADPNGTFGMTVATPGAPNQQ